LYLEKENPFTKYFTQESRGRREREGKMNTLASFEMYRSEVFSRQRRDECDIDQIIQRAREGDNKACETLIEQCLPFVVKLAWRFKPFLPHDDYGDIVGIGNLALVTCLDKTLRASQPVAYLMSCAYYRVLEHVSCRASLISNPKTSKATPVRSIETQLWHQNTRASGFSWTARAQYANDWLAEALNSLTPLQREVILVKYGFPQRSFDSLYQLSRAHGVRGRYPSSLKAALRKLRRFALQYRITHEETFV
jgi:RNA polymerase sigma factor (sigma-70 family)